MGWFDQFQLLRQPAVNPIPPPYNEGGVPGENGNPNPAPVQPPPGVPSPTPTPAPAPSPWNPGTALAGWDPTKWADQNHQSHKYKIGRILNKYPPTVEGLKQALPEIQQAYPGAKILGLGDLDLGLGEDPVDVLRGASQGGSAWQWLTTDEAKAGPTGGLTPGMPSNASVPTFPGGAAFGGAGASYSGGWTMPKGSDYQFQGVPGFTSGITGDSTRITAAGGTRDPLGMTTTGSGAAPTTGAFGQPSSSTGTFGAGQVTSPSMPTTGDGPKPQGDGPKPTQTGSGAFGASYDRAPSFTPMDPFAPPESPEATQYTPMPNGEKFVLPTGQSALDADPGYQFRLTQGLDALQNSASARGLLRTGGTLKDIQDFGQRAASQEYQNAVDRALQVAGFNEGTRRFDQDFGLKSTGFNADQTQQKYKNTFDALNQKYAYAQQQNLAGNAQALEGYKTDVGRELGRMGIQLTADQNNFMNSMNAQQQQWMQAYMMNGQSFDQAYKLLMANLEYPH